MTPDTKDSVDLALRDALAKAITQEGFVPLVSSAKTGEGLFPKQTPSVKKAIKLCFDPAMPLLGVKKADEAAEEKAKAVKLVRIKDKGIERLVEMTPVRDLSSLIKSSSWVWKAKVLNQCLRGIVRRSNEPSHSGVGESIKACFDAAQEHLDELSARLNEIVDSQRAIAEAVLKFTKSVASAFEKQSQRLSEVGNGLAEARTQLVAPPTDLRRDIDPP